MIEKDLVLTGKDLIQHTVIANKLLWCLHCPLIRKDYKKIEI